MGTYVVDKSVAGKYDIVKDLAREYLDSKRKENTDMDDVDPIYKFNLMISDSFFVDHDVDELAYERIDYDAVQSLLKLLYGEIRKDLHDVVMNLKRKGDHENANELIKIVEKTRG